MCAPRGAQRAGAARARPSRRAASSTSAGAASLDVHRLWRLAVLLRRERIDVLHSHLFGSNLWGTLLGRLCRVPVLIAHEHTWSYEGAPDPGMDRRPRDRAPDYAVHRRVHGRRRAHGDDRGRARRQGDGDPHRVRAAAPITARRRPARPSSGSAPDTPLIGTAVVMRPQKALEVMLDAFATVLETVPDAHLVLAGRRRRAAPNSSDTSADAGVAPQDALPRASQRRRLGRSRARRRRPVVGFRRHCRCSCSSAWPAGTPLVATAVGGLPDVVEDGVTGLLVPPRRPRTSWRPRSCRSCSDPELRAGAWRQRPPGELEKYTIDRIAGRFADLYESLVAAARRDRQALTVSAVEVMVLCYHAVSPTWEAPLSVTPEALRAPDAMLARRGWRATTFTDAVLARRRPAGRWR